MTHQDKPESYLVDAEVDVLRSKRRILEEKLAIAEAYRRLATITAEFPTLDLLSEEERARLRSVQTKLPQSMRDELSRIRLDPPADVDIEQFVRDWVDDNWLNTLSHVATTDGTLPRSMIDKALRALYLENQSIHEVREELFEIHRGISWTWGPKVQVWSRKFQIRRDRVRVWFVENIAHVIGNRLGRRAHLLQYISRLKQRKENRIADLRTLENTRVPGGFAKKANEIRSQKTQHRIQYTFSAMSFLFTGGTAIFMVAMLFVGLFELYNAAAIGLGVGVEIPTYHATTKSMATANQTTTATADQSAHSAHETLTFFRSRNPHTAMESSLTALEIILVAPLPYLLVLGLTRYIKALAYQEQADEFRRELLEFKAFEVALFIAIIAAAVVGRVLGGELRWEFAGSVTLIISVLAAYYFLIEKAAKEAAEEERERQHEITEERRRQDAKTAPVTADDHAHH
jgi:hypothetical protein